MYGKLDLYGCKSEWPARNIPLWNKKIKKLCELLRWIELKMGSKIWYMGLANSILNNLLFVVYGIFKSVHLRPYITQAFKPLKTATHQNARPAAYRCISLRITLKIWTTAYVAGPHNTQCIYQLFVQKASARNRVTNNQHFTLTSRNDSEAEEEKICPALWTRTLGLTRWTKTSRIYASLRNEKPPLQFLNLG